MKFIPQLKSIKSTLDLNFFANIYTKCSGLPIPDAYLNNPNNHVFGIYYNNELIGGFILGNGPAFRTVSVFAEKENQESVYETMKDKSLYTEICCFWIKRQFRTKTLLNFFTWFSMAYALKKYGNRYFLFGTCSRSLAKLYSATSKSILIHRDFIKDKPTFVFWAARKNCISGIVAIVKFKLKRVLRINKNPLGSTDVGKEFIDSIINYNVI